ncbi:MAG: hypothetical protein ACK559_07325, partial [bacterium]
TFSDKNDRLARAANKFESVHKDWDSLLRSLRDKRSDLRNRKYSRDPSRTRLASFSPFEMSLIERSQQFAYDTYGSRCVDPVGLTHTCKNLERERDAVDFQSRKNSFYQMVRNADVHYEP